MVHHAVQNPTHEFVNSPPQHALGCGVCKSTSAFGIHPVNAFPDGMQDQLVFALHVLEQFFHPTPFKQAAPVVVVGIVALPKGSQLASVPQQQQHILGFRLADPG
jgi:hypothetical protein